MLTSLKAIDKTCYMVLEDPMERQVCFLYLSKPCTPALPANLQKNEHNTNTIAYIMTPLGKNRWHNLKDKRLGLFEST